MSTLAGKTIIVTGSARGVGLAIAQRCASHGARLILADILTELGEQAAAQLRTEGVNARFIPLDLGDPSSIDRFAADIAAHEGSVDGLVNNAAIATNVGGLNFDAIEMELWDRVMRVNVRGTWLVTRAIVPLMPTGGTHESGRYDAGGRIVNLASDTALWGAPRLLAYISSKGAVMAMTRGLARELGPRGIGICAVAPGIMRNEATDYVPAARHQEYETGRAVPGVQFPEDITETIAFLLTPGALALTGQVLPVDAGFVFT